MNDSELNSRKHFPSLVCS